MEGLQICVRMTDGISFSLSSHRLSNKGLIEVVGAPPEAQREGSRAAVSQAVNTLRSPDAVPHVEAVQRLRAIGAPSRQAHKCRQPVGHVDELAADRPGSLQQRAGDEADPPDASFPQGLLPASQRPVAPTSQRLTAVIWGEKCHDTKMEKGFKILGEEEGGEGEEEEGEEE